MTCPARLPETQRPNVSWRGRVSSRSVLSLYIKGVGTAHPNYLSLPDSIHLSQIMSEIEELWNFGALSICTDSDNEEPGPTESMVKFTMQIWVLVLTAIKTLDEKNGSSLEEIQMWIFANHGIDVEQQMTSIRKYLVYAMRHGMISQTGTYGSEAFKLTDPRSRVAGTPME